MQNNCVIIIVIVVIFALYLFLRNQPNYETFCDMSRFVELHDAVIILHQNVLSLHLMIPVDGEHRSDMNEILSEIRRINNHVDRLNPNIHNTSLNQEQLNHLRSVVVNTNNDISSINPEIVRLTGARVTFLVVPSSSAPPSMPPVPRMPPTMPPRTPPVPRMPPTPMPPRMPPSMPPRIPPVPRMPPTPMPPSMPHHAPSPIIPWSSDSFEGSFY